MAELKKRRKLFPEKIKDRQKVSWIPRASTQARQARNAAA